jgi:hypothetical protein
MPLSGQKDYPDYSGLNEAAGFCNINRNKNAWKNTVVSCCFSHCLVLRATYLYKTFIRSRVKLVGPVLPTWPDGVKAGGGGCKLTP